MVFEWVPIFHGKYFTYQDYIGILAASVLTIIGLVFYLIAKLLPFFEKLKSRLKSSTRKKRKLDSPLEYTDVELVGTETKNKTLETTETDDEDIVEDTDEKSTCLSTAANILSWISATFFSTAPIAIMAFDMISAPWSVILSALILLNEYRNHLYRQYPSAAKPTNSRFERLFRVFRIAAQNSTAAMQLVLVLIALFSFGGTILFQNTCVVVYNNENHGFVFDGDLVSWSSKLTRHFTLDTQCRPGPPCHLFATLPEDASTAVIINVHTHVDVTNITLYYEEVDDLALLQGKLGKNSVQPQSFLINKIEAKGQRVCHHGLIENLNPNTTYYIQVYYDGQIQAAHSYRTLPDKDHKAPMTIIQGGDAGENKISRQIMTQISYTNPDVVLIGGDLAYDNNIRHCYYAWDGFLTMFDDLNKKVGRLVPLIMGVGNHDAGLDPNSQRQITIDEGGPWLFAWMAQSTKRDPTNPSKRIIPEINDRKSYDYHLIGKILFLNLDSAYLSPFYGSQLDFIKSISYKHPEYLKMAQYHNPIYSSCGTPVIEAEQYWVPEFDNFRFLAAFENHVHVFKRTFPLTGRKYNPKGTVYLGDGNWGANSQKCTENNSTGILAVFNNHENYFWKVIVDENEVTYTAITKTGAILDQGYSQKIADYQLVPVN